MKITRSNFWYIVGIILMIMRTYINNSKLANVVPLYDVILLPVIIISFFFKFLNEKYTRKEFIILILASCFCIYTSYKTSKYVILMSCLALIALKNVDVEKVIKSIFITNVVCLTLYTIVYLLNYYYNPASVDTSFLYSGKIRHTFYFNHPNMYASMYFWTLAEYIFLKREKIKVSTYVIIVIFSFFAFSFTQTRTLLICVILLLIFNILGHKNNAIFYDFCKFFTKYGFIILSFVCIILVANYEYFYNTIPNVIDKIDLLLSRRFSLSSMIENKYGFSFFPQVVNYNQTFNWKNIYQSQLIVDNVFLQCALIYGIVYNILISILFYFGGKYVKIQRYYIYMSLAIITGIVESYLMNVCIAFPLLLLVKSIYDKSETKKDGVI